MKRNLRIRLTVFLVGIFYTASFAQVLPQPETKTFGKLNTRQENNRGFMNCQANSIYGQEPFSEMIVGIPSAMFYGFGGTLAIENFPESVETITGITFWGAFTDNINNCIQEDPVTFNILFFNDDFIPDFIPAQVIELTLTGQLMMFDDIPVYRFDAMFPEPVNVSETPLFSIVQLFQMPDTPKDDRFTCVFYWLASDQGDLQSAAISLQFGEITDVIPLPVDLAFCLYQPGVYIPVKNWALWIGLLMMTTLLIFRFRSYSRS